ncbi:MAG TPA: hypothetical protein VFH27_11395, partial [Longimicrobiaceae bacterium]|nr:hypothetical protein [Longimicrobiaceae bacterium]
MPGRVLAFRVATRQTLQRLATDALPAALVEEGREREHVRDVFWDTEDGELEGRGITVRLRHHADGGRTLTVQAAGQWDETGAAEWSALVRDGVPDEAALAGGSDAAARLGAMVDPSRLRQRMELVTDRTTRLAHPVALPGSPVRFHLDAVTVRGQGAGVEAYALEVHLPEQGADDAAEAARALADAWGLRPARADARGRAAERLAEHEVEELERALRGARRVAVIALRAGAIAVRNEGGVLHVPTGRGRGEDACRRVLGSCFGSASGLLRLLGTSPGTAQQPATEVWLAERAWQTDAGACTPDLVWIDLDEMLAAVGSPALRDAATLAALNVLARAEMPVAADETDGHAPPAVHALLELDDEAPPADAEALGPGTLLNMELSTLAFNRRVLSLSEDDEVPLFERLRFLSIFSANLDEFFRVRVAAFKRQVAAGSTKRTLDGVAPQEQLDAIGVRARRLLQRAYDTLYGQLLPALRTHGIQIVRPAELGDDEQGWLAEHFRRDIQAMLTPLAAGPGHPFPHIRNLRPALCALVRQP